MAGVFLSAAAVVRLVASVDLTAVRTALSVIRPWAPLVLQPFAFQALLESAAWRLLFA